MLNEAMKKEVERLTKENRVVGMAAELVITNIAAMQDEHGDPRPEFVEASGREYAKRGGVGAAAEAVARAVLALQPRLRAEFEAFRVKHAAVIAAVANLAMAIAAEQERDEAEPRPTQAAAAA